MSTTNEENNKEITKIENIGTYARSGAHFSELVNEVIKSKEWKDIREAELLDYSFLSHRIKAIFSLHPVYHERMVRDFNSIGQLLENFREEKLSGKDTAGKIIVNKLIDNLEERIADVCGQKIEGISQSITG